MDLPPSCAGIAPNHASGFAYLVLPMPEGLRDSTKLVKARSAVPDTAAMGEPQVSRWRRYGKDRLYVNADTGERIGWVDLVTGTQALEDASGAEEFQIAVAGFCAAHGLPRPTDGAPPGVPEPRPLRREPATQESAALPSPAEVLAPRSPTQAPMPILLPTTTAASAHVAGVTPAWVDLSLNVAGQAARAQAEAELVAMRGRSRVGTFLARTFDMKTDERAWRVGAGGEETIGAKLEKLRKHGWHVLHAVPVGDRGSDIDHVVIGPGGVWTLNTKTHPGKHVWVGKHQVRVDGHKTDYLRNSRHEADRASRLLSEACDFPVHVKAALVFLTGSLIPNVTIKQAPEDVAVLDRMDIPAAFRRSQARLTDEQVTAIFDQARRSTTWETSQPTRGARTGVPRRA
jgi:hypothetical protein